MEFTTENITAIIVAIVMGLPSIILWISKFREGKSKTKFSYQDKLRELTDVNVCLLSVLVVYDTILQKIFITNPNINGELRQEWINANAKLKELRDRMTQE